MVAGVSFRSVSECVIMAKITFLDTLGDHGFVSSFYDAATLKVTSSTASTATMLDNAGARVVFAGDGLAFDGQQPTAGTITGIDLFDSSGNLLTHVARASILAVDLFTQFQSLGLLGIELAIIAGNDKILGASVSDFIIGQGGNDKIYGGAGNDALGGGDGKDTIYGGVGDDVMTGEKGLDVLIGNSGADTFLYLRGNGHDTIIDCSETGANATRDHIEITRAQYHGMTAATATATATQVGLDLVSLDRSDFTWARS